MLRPRPSGECAVASQPWCTLVLCTSLVLRTSLVGLNGLGRPPSLASRQYEIELLSHEILVLRTILFVEVPL